MNREIKSRIAYLSPLFADELFCIPNAGSTASLGLIKQIREFRKGEHLFAVGEMPVCIYRVIKGSARLLMTDESKEIRISRLVEPNEVLGLPEAICGILYEVDAKAITACTCEFVGREDLIRFLQNEPGAGSRLAGLLGSNLQNSYKAFLSQ